MLDAIWRCKAFRACFCRRHMAALVLNGLNYQVFLYLSPDIRLMPLWSLRTLDLILIKSMTNSEVSIKGQNVFWFAACEAEIRL